MRFYSKPVKVKIDFIERWMVTVHGDNESNSPLYFDSEEKANNWIEKKKKSLSHDV